MHSRVSQAASTIFQQAATRTSLMSTGRSITGLPNTHGESVWEQHSVSPFPRKFLFGEGDFLTPVEPLSVHVSSGGGRCVSEVLF